eukprot:3852951-Rhodomonas_salina.1
MLTVVVASCHVSLTADSSNVGAARADDAGISEGDAAVLAFLVTLVPFERLSFMVATLTFMAAQLAEVLDFTFILELGSAE